MGLADGPLVFIDTKKNKNNGKWPALRCGTVASIVALSIVLEGKEILLYQYVHRDRHQRDIRRPQAILLARRQGDPILFCSQAEP